MNAQLDALNVVKSQDCQDVPPSLSQRDTGDAPVPVHVPAEIEDIFETLFEGAFLPTPDLRIDAVVKDRQFDLNRILMRCRAMNSGCWEWQGAATAKGYGRVKIDRKLYSPHRVVAWAMDIAPSMGDPSRTTVVMHSCDNPRCCNPEHLSLGTHSENMIDCAKKGRMPHQKKRG